MGSIGVSLVAWFVAPALLLALTLGSGLLLERLTGFRLPNALLAPVGSCAAFLLGHAVYRVGGGVALVAPLLVVAALAGFVLARRGLRERLSPGLWPGLAALATFALFLAPVVLAGGWTWTGYNFVNDTAVQFILADHVADAGMSDPVGPPDTEPYSTTTEHVRAYFSTGYPIGSHGLLVVMSTLTGVPLEAAYNPFLAFLMSLATLSMAALLRRSGMSAPAAAATAFTATAANLTYHYALQGNVKEIAMLALVGAAWAVARREPGPLLYVVAAAVTLAVIAPRTSPYADGKMLALLSPGILALAGYGAACGLSRLWLPAAYGLAALAAAGGIWADAAAYHVVT